MSIINNEVFISRNGLSFIYELLEEKERLIMDSPTVEDIRSILSTASENIVFDEPNHTYSYNDIKYPSVSSVLKKYTPDFPAKLIAERMASNRRRIGESITAQEILKEWEYKKDQASAYGSLVHYRLEEYLSSFLEGKIVKPVSINFGLLTEDLIVRADNAVNTGIRWINEMIDNGYELINTEQMLLNRVLGFCGTVDLLFLKDNKLVIADWKSNIKDITNDSYNNYLTNGLETLKATTLNKYNVQLNLYKKLLESVVPIKVSEMLVVHLNCDLYLEGIKTYECSDLSGMIK
jgi:hypothetical protein